MSNLVKIETLNRRELIRSIALAITAVGSLDLEAAQHVHSETSGEKKATGAYKVKAFQPNEYKTLQRLAEIIVPVDEVSGSALDAGAPEFIDTLCSQNPTLAAIFHGGLAWLDAEMRKRPNTTLVEMLDLLVAAEKEESARRREELLYQRSPEYKAFSGYTVKRAGDLGPGVKFFDWVRKMTVDAFYTSPIGIKDIGFLGNKAYSKYEVPQEAIDYAMKRSPFA